mmetsp:Transcript_106619/g.339489  ORF Transcript_106619/g.339489 Transcript_106619/m.339489 type:complete len:85 (+) Transcript_106619:158-412(+)
MSPRVFESRRLEKDAAGISMEERIIAAARSGNLKRIAQLVSECGDIQYTTHRDLADAGSSLARRTRVGDSEVPPRGRLAPRGPR